MFLILESPLTAEGVPISDVDVVVDSGSPQIRASAESIVVSDVSAAIVLAGTPVIRANVEEVVVSDVSAAITAGTPVIRATAEVVSDIGAAAVVTAGTPVIRASTEEVPISDVDVVVDSGSPQIRARAESVTISDAAAIVLAGTPIIRASARTDTITIETPVRISGTITSGIPSLDGTLLVINPTIPGVGVPSAPLDLVATAFNQTRIDLTWNVPASDGGSPITGYKVEYSDVRVDTITIPEGVDGKGWEFVFRRTTAFTQPTQIVSSPAGLMTDGYVPVGATDEPQGSSAQIPYEWSAVRKYNYTTKTWGEFSSWFIFDKYGRDGIGREFVYRRTSTNSAPPQIVSTAAGLATDGYAPPNTTDEPTGVTQSMPFEWVAQRKYSNLTESWSEFGSWKRWGHFGTTGADGKGWEWVFRRTAADNQPTQIMSTSAGLGMDDYVPTGATDEPQGISEQLPYEWAAVRKYDQTAQVWNEFGAWFRWSKFGLDGKGWEYVFRRTTADTEPTTIVTTTANRSVDEFVPPNTTDDPTGVTDTIPYEWGSVRKYNPDTKRWSEFSSWFLWTHFGTTGATGDPGEDGKGWEFVFQQTATDSQPTQIASSQTGLGMDGYVPTGATDEPQGTSEALPFEWAAVRKYDPDNDIWNEFSSWFRWSKYGLDGKGWEYVFRRTNDSDEPTTIVSTNAGRLTDDYVPPNTTDDPTGVNSVNPFEWGAVRKYNPDTKRWSEFSSWFLWTHFGMDGDPGLPGSDGKGWEFVFRRTTTDSQPTQVVSSVTGLGMDDYVPTGTTDSPQGTSEVNPFEWGAVRKYDQVNQTWNEFSEWFRWSNLGLDGKGWEYVFRLTLDDTEPTTIVTTTANRIVDDFVPPNTTDDPSGVSADMPYEWGSVRKYNPDTKRWSEFSSWFLWSHFGSGISYKELIAYRVLSRTASPPARPTNTGSFEFSTQTYTPPTGWVATWPSHSVDQVVYAIAATAQNAEGDLWETDANDWASPVVVSQDGSVNVVYRRFTSDPTVRPGDSSGVPTGYYDSVDSVPGTITNGAIYASFGIRPAGVNLFIWQLPVKLEGQDGDPGEDGEDGDDGDDGLDGQPGFSDSALWTSRVSSSPSVTGQWNMSNASQSFWNSSLFRLTLYATDASALENRLIGIQPGGLVTIYQNGQNWGAYRVGSVNSFYTTGIDMRSLTLVTSAGAPSFSLGSGVEIRWNTGLADTSVSVLPTLGIASSGTSTPLTLAVNNLQNGDRVMVLSSFNYDGLTDVTAEQLTLTRSNSNTPMGVGRFASSTYRIAQPLSSPTYGACAGTVQGFFTMAGTGTVTFTATVEALILGVSNIQITVLVFR